MEHKLKRSTPAPYSFLGETSSDNNNNILNYFLKALFRPFWNPNEHEGDKDNGGSRFFYYLINSSLPPPSLLPSFSPSFLPSLPPSLNIPSFLPSSLPPSLPHFLSSLLSISFPFFQSLLLLMIGI